MLYKKTLKELVVGLNKKKFSSSEVVKDFFKRIKKYDNTINAFITLCEEQAIKKAKKIDNLPKIKKTFFSGIPIAEKDLFCTKSIKTTCGSRMLNNFFPSYNSTISEKLLNNGFITIGKTNMDEFAMGSSTENSFFGPTYNPWNKKYTSGGSSGGSSAAVSAGFCPIATGSDTGGSIRQPSAFCNLTGIKPTYGLLSRFGMIAFASSLDQAGIIAKNAEDIALLLEVIEGYDNKDLTSINMPTNKGKYSSFLNNSIHDQTIGIPIKYIENNLCAEEIDIFYKNIKRIESLNIKIKNVDLDFIYNNSVECYYIIANSEAASNLARYDGIRYGFKTNINDSTDSLIDIYKKTRSIGFGKEVKKRIILGNYMLSKKYYEAFYKKASNIRIKIINHYKEIFKEVDYLFTPVIKGGAFKIGKTSADSINMYYSDVFNTAVNLAGLPSIAFPIGFYNNNMPIGGQIIGKEFSEKNMLNIIFQYQRKYDNIHKKSPKIL